MSSSPAPPLLSLSLCPLSDSVNGSLSICIDPIPIVISMLTSTRSNCWATTQSVRLGCMIASSLIGSQFPFLTIPISHIYHASRSSLIMISIRNSSMTQGSAQDLT